MGILPRIACWLAVLNGATGLQVWCSDTCCPGTLYAAGVSQSGPANALDPENSEENLAERRERQFAASAGLLAVVGIAISGVALIAGIVLWAGYLRRRNRRPLPNADARHEFWFLRTRRGETPSDRLERDE